MIFRCFYLKIISFGCIFFSFGCHGQLIGQAADPIPFYQALGLSLSPQIIERSFQGRKPIVFLLGDSAQRTQDGNFILNGRAQIRRYDGSIKANEIFYNETTSVIEAKGGVQLNVMGSVFSGPYAFYNINSEQGYLLHPNYYLNGNRARGKAERIDILNNEKSRITEGTYSTCMCEQPDWYLQSKRLDINQNESIGTARNAVLYFKKVPVFALPYFTFPLTKERKSGVLPPHINFDTRNGLDIEFPIYFNLAPNYDFLFRPRVLQRHGIQWAADYRFLVKNYSGIVSAEILPFDKILNKKNRYSFRFKYDQEVMPGGRAYIDAQRVSDNSYTSDLTNSDDVLQFGTQSLIEQAAGFTYVDGPWNILFRTQNWQYFASASVVPYARSPELDVKYRRIHIGGFDFDMRANATNFKTRMVNSLAGSRLFLESSISYPLFGRSYFIIPTLNSRFVAYALTIPSLQGGSDMTAHHFFLAIPTLSLNTGLTLERPINILGHKFFQTLEPHLFYAYTPYVDQSLAPIFDTAAIDLDETRIFTANNYVGYDRVSDGSRVTFGLSSRFIQLDDGEELIRLTVAQQRNLQNQRTLIPGESFLAKGRSDLLFNALMNVNRHFAFQTGLQLNPDNQKVIRRAVGLVWSPAERNLVNLRYRSFRVNEFYGNGGKIRQGIFSSQWAFTSNVYGIARLNYSLQEKKLIDGAIGLQYDNPCWTFGFALQRYSSDALNMENPTVLTRIMMQIEFKGLANISNGLISAFRSSVPGYLSPPSLDRPLSRFAHYN